MIVRERKMKWHSGITRIYWKHWEVDQIVSREKREANIHLRAEHIMKGNGLVNRGMDMEFKFG